MDTNSKNLRNLVGTYERFSTKAACIQWTRKEFLRLLSVERSMMLEQPLFTNVQAAIYPRWEAESENESFRNFLEDCQLVLPSPVFVIKKDNQTLGLAPHNLKVELHNLYLGKVIHDVRNLVDACPTAKEVANKLNTFSVPHINGGSWSETELRGFMDRFHIVTKNAKFFSF